MAHYESGDVIEIETGHGVRYVQVAHKLSGLPEVIRILPIKGEDTDATDWRALAALRSLQILMMPLRTALERGDLNGRHVGHAPMPHAEDVFPTFRIPVRNRHGEVVYWWLWDGRGLTYDIHSSVDLDNLPIREVTSATMLLRILKDR